MKTINKEILIWIVAITGKILLGLTVYNLSKISNNIEKLNTSVESLYRITDRMDVRQGVTETRVNTLEYKLSDHDKELKDVYKKIYQQEK